MLFSLKKSQNTAYKMSEYRLPRRLELEESSPVPRDNSVPTSTMALLLFSLTPSLVLYKQVHQIKLHSVVNVQCDARAQLSYVTLTSGGSGLSISPVK